MKALSAWIVLGVLSCAAAPAEETVASPSLQAIVDRIAAAHPEIARLSIHAVPAGGKELQIVASTVAGRIGERSDPEDLDASRTGRVIEMKEGHNLDYTAPVQDAAGKTMAVVGVTISGAGGTSDEELRVKAKAVAAETAAAIRSAG